MKDWVRDIQVEELAFILFNVFFLRLSCFGEVHLEFENRGSMRKKWGGCFFHLLKLEIKKLPIWEPLKLKSNDI